MSNPYVWRIIEVVDSSGVVQMGLKLDMKNKLFVFNGIDLNGGNTKAKFDVRRFPKLSLIFQEGIHKIVVRINTNSVILWAGKSSASRILHLLEELDQLGHCYDSFLRLSKNWAEKDAVKRVQY